VQVGAGATVQVPKVPEPAASSASAAN